MARSVVTLTDLMGDDLSVVNAARVSFSKRVNRDDITKFTEVHYNGWSGSIPELDSKDIKLINYLAKHNHWSPFGHASLQFYIKAPVFVARQLVKHQIGLTWNEVSRRYVDYEPEFYDVDSWRGRAENKKQGSDAENTVEWINRNQRTGTLQTAVENIALKNYNLIE